MTIGWIRHIQVELLRLGAAVVIPPTGIPSGIGKPQTIQGQQSSASELQYDTSERRCAVSSLNVLTGRLEQWGISKYLYKYRSKE